MAQDAAPSNLCYGGMKAILGDNSMLDVISSEILVSFGLIGISVLIIVGALSVVWPWRENKSDVDVDAAVRNAPYHLLHEQRSLSSKEHYD